MPRRRSIRKTKRRIYKAKDCNFCKVHSDPDFKDIDGLRHFLSDRGRILPRLVTGICQKHQLRVARCIKQARYMALLPFVVRPS